MHRRDKMEKKYFIVTAKCGHVRRKRYILIDFAVEASNGKEAASIARHLPRVKHHHKDAIRNVQEVEYEAYCEQLILNSKDTYLKATSKQEQNRCCPDLEERIEEEDYEEENHDIKRQQRINYIMKKRQIDHKINLSY